MEAFQRLLAYGWPGNVRELRNVIRTALAICDGGVVRLSDLPSEVRNSEVRNSETRSAEVSDSVTADPSIAQPAELHADAPSERQRLLETIDACGGNMSNAAQRLGVSRNTLYRRCKQLGIPLSGGKWVRP
jgi:transcriptional regulator of acetoin/glycerol metabolism